MCKRLKPLQEKSERIQRREVGSAFDRCRETVPKGAGGKARSTSTESLCGKGAECYGGFYFH